ncbi:MAG TPA: FAD/NAD(P)-binding protein [Ktedonobacterales bacterium]|nr:FAD/NAD(P)-binding protein [Ktedonobacterales bacterium]
MIASADAIADPLLPRAYRVQRVRRELHDTWTLTLVPADEQASPPFAAGQFNMLYVFGVGEIPISISGDPGRPGGLVQTVRAVGAVSQALCALNPKAMIGVRGPFGSAWPLSACYGRDVLVIGGGIGLAPLRPVVYQILAKRERYGRVALLYGARTPSDLLYRAELERWRAHGAIDVLVTVDRGTADWSGSVGVVTKLIDRASFDAANAVALVCGPEIMMRFSADGVLKRGITADRVFVSMERDMQCGVGLCGHCQYGPVLVCRDGPVFRYDHLADLLPRREI